MLPYIFFICLIVQIYLILKLIIGSANRKLNIYLSFVPGTSVFTVIIEIILYYTTDTVEANKLYYGYQILGFILMIFFILSIVEYVKMYSQKYKPIHLKLIQGLVISINVSWIVLVSFNGPTAKIFLQKTHLWDIDYSRSVTMFSLHLYETIFWLGLSFYCFVYLAIKSEQKYKKWFCILAVWEMMMVSGVIFILIPHPSPEVPQYYFISSIPLTIGTFINVLVLSNFTLFDINAKNIYADVIAATNNWVIILDNTGEIKFVNNIVLTKANYPINWIINKPVDNIIIIKENEQENLPLPQFIKQSLDKNYIEITLQFKNSGYWFKLQSSLRKITLPDSSQVFLWILIDNTTIEALKTSKEILETKKEKLDKAYKDISFIINMTSHDLKIPLKTVIELAELVKIENTIIGSNRSEEYLNYIVDVSKQSLSLTTQLIEYMRVGVVEKKLDWCDIDLLFIEIEKRLFYQIEQCGAEISFTGLRKVFLDGAQIQELLVNFIDNSIKYQSNIKPIMEIDISENESRYIFSISDNGIGIDPSFLPRVFEQYSREHKKAAFGTGIGMYLCKNIIEANNGIIHIKNNKFKEGITILFEIEKLLPVIEKDMNMHLNL